jgi:hypothetical protein
MSELAGGQELMTSAGIQYAACVLSAPFSKIDRLNAVIILTLSRGCGMLICGNVNTYF